MRTAACLEDLAEVYVDDFKADSSHFIVYDLVVFDGKNLVIAQSLYIAAVLENQFALYRDNLEVPTLKHLDELIGQLVDSSDADLFGNYVKYHVEMQVCGRARNAYYGIAILPKLLAHICYAGLVGAVYKTESNGMFIDHPYVAALKAACVAAADNGNANFLELCFISRSLTLTCRVTEASDDRAFLNAAAKVSCKGLNLHRRIRVHFDNFNAVFAVSVHEIIPFLDHKVVLFCFTLFHPALGDFVDGIENIVLGRAN